MKDLFGFPARFALLFLAICAGLAAFAVVAAAEPQILLPRHVTTRPANVRAVETIQRLYLSDGTIREKSLGIVTLGRSDELRENRGPRPEARGQETESGSREPEAQ